MPRTKQQTDEYTAREQAILDRLDRLSAQVEQLNARRRLTLKPEQAAEQLNVSMPTMYQLCKRDDFPAVRYGRSITIPTAQLETWLKDHAGEIIG